MADTKTVDVLAVLKEMRRQLPPGKQDPITLLRKENPIAGHADAAIAAIDELIGVADEAYAELLADSHRDGPRCLLLTRLETALRAVGGAE